ncbi:hypothetical protein U9M48_044238 [Paspalum notatum var. saurae]|uniref:Uncharacterized protein n=1 Tax=Paspalum notatum var. saurae TaxID=547442 RepID=A0AAQ3XHA5_PASNO
MGDSSSSASYIRMVHHLIEKCMCFNLSKEECMDALEKHANVNPVITSTGCSSIYSVISCDLGISNCISPSPCTVWKELEKENKEFFETYNKDREERNIEAETMQRIQKMLSEAAAAKSSDDDEEG